MLASAVAVAGHVAVFLVAARTAGVDRVAGELLPLALLVLLAAAVPLNVAGWGPREGVAAWAFAAAGLGAAQGATVAVVYGVLALVATLPGAVLLLAGWQPPRDRGARPARGSRAVADRPYTLLSCGMSIDGYLDSADRASGCCCPTTPTSTGSTRCAPGATRSWSAPPRSATTTRGCWCAPDAGASSGSPAGCRRRRSR